MEELRKGKILDAALALFREKGYSAVSMQNIAEACGMAKASIYKFFASKEDLFTEVFTVCYRSLLEQEAELDRVQSQQGLAPKEKFRRKIEFQLYYTMENHLFMLDFKELPITANDKFLTAWQNKKAAMLSWHRELLTEAYGEQIDHIIWDVVTIFRGMLLQYLSYAIQKVLAVPMAELAAFLVDRMDAVVRDMAAKQPKPIIDGANVYFNHLNPSNKTVRQETIQQFLYTLAEKIDELPKPEAVRAELREVVSLIQQEAQAERRNPTLLRALAAYLNNVFELRADVRQLNLLLF
ncbi:helix-turn-helix domain-containing protein [Paenibacillus sp. KS-LC4]|uniref:TetR/AcrR family transcriptional regulator n=1 Tax=Paenibacillus sp. KS-LC4 TaxID=2979727 RepID=UPI0030CFF590